MFLHSSLQVLYILGTTLIILYALISLLLINNSWDVVLPLFPFYKTVKDFKQKS